MSLSRVKVWAPGDTLLAQDLNNEFSNITNNVLAEPIVLSQNIDINGKIIILDDDGNTTIDATTNDQITIAINGANDFRLTPNLFTALAGSSITLAQGNVNMTSGDVAFTAGRVLMAKGADVASASTITVPTDSNTFDITGTTTITAFSAVQAGTIFYVRFTGTGLNITYNATSMISPWACDYRTVQNEVLAFWSLGSGNYIFWSLNGPKEQTGMTVEWDGTGDYLGGLLQDGTSYLRTDYPGLFAKIGTTYGAADGSHFNVADRRGRVGIGVDGAANRITASSTNGANADTLGGVGGAETHTLSTSELPPHAPTLRLTDNSGASSSNSRLAASVGNLDVGAVNSDVDVFNSAGGGGAHNNTQPWIAKKYYVRF
jgi:microcystin-dependent protein